MSLVAVYTIKNCVTGKMYIGQSVHPEKRFKSHLGKNNRCLKLAAAIKKHGVDSFELHVVHWCQDKADANELEMFLIQELDTIANGYNITPGGYGTGSGKDNPFYGRQHSEAVRRASSRRAKNMVRSPEHIAKLHEGKRNAIVSDETKEKLRQIPISELCRQRTIESNKQRVWSEEARDKLRRHNTGKTATQETKAKIAAANKERVWTPESRAKLAESMKAAHARRKLKT